MSAGCGGGETEAPLAQTVEGTTLPKEEETSAPKGDPQAGKAVFAEAGCGGCHVLSDAGTNGQIGPNLDETNPTAELAVERVTNGMGAMPAFKDQLSEKQIADVAAYVAEAAGD